MTGPRRDTVAEMVRRATEDLAQAGIESASRDARQLVALATGRPVDRLTLEADAPVSLADWQTLGDLLPLRIARRPLSHLTGKRAFWEHVFEVTPDVLDPRPETECLIAQALQGPVRRVLDLGTGSGAILLSILAARPRAQGLGSDLSPAALRVAARNADRLGVAARCDLIQSDWFEGISGQFDLIVSNPPYIAAAEMAGLAPELAHEPRMALTDEGDGLSAYHIIAAGASAHLSHGGRVLVEIGPTQADAVQKLFEQAGLSAIGVLPDLDGRDRIVQAARL